MIKHRKQRKKSKDLNFDGAHQYDREIPHIMTHTYAVDKLDFRLKNKLCLGCGKKECACKRKG